jgi:hypothetical protein
MSNILVAKEVRRRFRAVLEAADLSVDIDGAPVPVRFMNQPPNGWRVDEKSLPAIYLFNSGERLSPEGISTVDRALQLDVVLMARDLGDPQDQLDDLQLAIEVAVLASGNLSGACYEIPLEGSAIAQDQGAVLFGVRTLTFRPVSNVTANDPSF